MAHNSLTAEFVKSIMDYNPQSGIFIWKIRPINHFPREQDAKTWNTRFSGKIAGSDHEGYIIIVIAGILYRAHRLAWLIMIGEWPQHEIDHYDLNKSNNKWDNLRPATSGQNSYNKKISKRNSSGIKGVYWCKNVAKWRAKIAVNNQEIHLGVFNDIIDATLAYKKAAEKYHGDFRRIA